MRPSVIACIRAMPSATVPLIGDNNVVIPPSRGLPDATVLLNASSTTGGVTQVTASATPTANRLQIAYVASAAAAAVNTPTCTGQGLTWVQVATVAYVAANRRLTVFRALGPSATAGALTFDFGGQTQTSVCWGQLEVSQTDTTGTDGSGAIVQAPSPATVGAGIGSIAAPTLAAFEHVNNLALVISANDISGTMTPDGAFTELTDVNIAAGNITLESQSARNVQTCTTTFSGTTAAGGGSISMEIKAS